MINNDMITLYQSICTKLQAICDEKTREISDYQAKASLYNNQVASKLQAIDRKLREIERYQKMAAAYLSNDAETRSYPPHKPKIELLESMYRDICQGNGNWLAIYAEASSGIAYLKNEKQKINIPNPQNKTMETISTRANQRCESILRSSDMQTLLSLSRQCDQLFAPAFFTRRKFVPSSRENTCPCGKVTFSFPVTDGCVALAKEMLTPYFLETTKSLFLPASISAITCIQVRSSLVDSIMQGLRAYVLNFLNTSVPMDEKIHYIDTCVFDKSALGSLLSIYDTRSKIFAPIAETPGTAKKQLDVLRSRIISTPGRRLLIYRYRQEKLDSTNENVLQWLCSNGAKYNLQIILVQEFSSGEYDFDKSLPYFLPANASILRSNASNFVETKKHQRMAWYTEPAVLSSEYCASILEAYAPQPLLTRYFDICPASTVPNYQRNRKKSISLLYGVDESGKRYSLDLYGMDFACYILGASRSGKSNLLNILITSAIINYHPDDLELWLVDFGRTEFNRYTKHLPPHVRYILIEKTTELVCSLVKQLIDEMTRRGRILSQYGVLEISQLPESVHMPRILVIIDEFGAMKEILTSEDIDIKTTYKGYMERLLRQGAKHGMSFIFSDQSFTDTYKALPEKGQEQIGLRLAMAANDSEMKSLLGTAGWQLSEKDAYAIQQLPKYQVLFRGRETGADLCGPVHVLYFSEEDKQKQLTLLDQINAAMKPIATGRDSATMTYVSHETLCLDRDNRPSLFSRRMQIGSDLVAWRKNDAYQDSDLLLYLGEPRNMSPVQHELLRNMKAENLLIYCDYAKNLRGLAEIIYAAWQSAIKQKYQVEFWCHERDSLYRGYIRNWAPSKVLCKGYDIMKQINTIGKMVAEHRKSKRLIIVSGLSALLTDLMDDIEEKKAFGQSNTFGGFGTEYLKQINQMAQESLKTGVIPNQPSSLFNQSEDQNIDVKRSLKNVLDFGPRYDTHFIVIVQSEGELKDAGIGQGEFKQLAGYASGMADVGFFRFKRFVEAISEGDMFGYYAGNTFTTYMPFLLEK